jgi:hypothetical protein
MKDDVWGHESMYDFRMPTTFSQRPLDLGFALGERRVLISITFASSVMTADVKPDPRSECSVRGTPNVAKFWSREIAIFSAEVLRTT